MADVQSRGTIEQALWPHAVGLPLAEVPDGVLLSRLSTFGILQGDLTPLISWLRDLDDVADGASIGQVLFLSDKFVSSAIVCIAQPVDVDRPWDLVELARAVFPESPLDISFRNARIVDLDSGAQLGILEYQSLRSSENLEVIHHVDGVMIAEDGESSLACSAWSSDLTLGERLLEFALAWMGTLRWTVVPVRSTE